MKRSIDSLKGCSYLVQQLNRGFCSVRQHVVKNKPIQCTCHTIKTRTLPMQHARRYCTVGDPPRRQNIEALEAVLGDDEMSDSENITKSHDDQLQVLDNTKINIVPVVQAQGNDPTKHTIDDEGLFYKVSNEDFVKFFKKGQWNSYHKQVQSFQECAVMVRRPALEIFDLVDSLNLKLPPAKFILYGKNGSGKSMTLAHVVHKYSTEGWLTIHVPDMINLVRYVHIRDRAHVKSIYKEGRYDLTEDARNWLIYFREQNITFLENLTTSKDYQWSERADSPEGSTLLSLANLGVDRARYASDIIGVLFKEIRAQAEDKGIKVLVAVEGVNGLWKDMGGLKNDLKQNINAQEFSFFRELLKLHEPTWTNGVCVGTVCAVVDALDTKLDKHSVPYTPAHLLKKVGFEHMDPFIPILVPDFTTKEAYNFIDYLIEKKWIIKPKGMSEQGKKELVQVSNKNPLDMVKISMFW